MRRLIAILSVLSLFGCSNNKAVGTGSLQLPDSLFAFHDIQNSLFVNQFWYDKKHDFEFYSDSIRKISFVKLDSIQKMKLIVPIVTSELGVDTSYVIRSMEARFISKQKKVGEFTPIVVWVNGDDYQELLYLLLDKNLTLTSHFVMYGGPDSGPSDRADSTMILQPYRHSFIKGNEIRSYALFERLRVNSVERPSIFDSITYISKILPTGQIKTQRVDSIRYERMSGRR
jgi:hypothetical protein